MKNNFRMLAAVTLALTATAAVADERRFSAADTTARIRKPGKIVITNDATSINAHRFFGNVKEALVSLRSMRNLATRPYGTTVFDGNAAVKAPAALSPIIAEAARTHGVDPRLVAAVVARESAWNPNAVSRVGASGLMQLMPATARFLGVTDVFDARQNIFGGTRYLRTLLDTFRGDLDLTLAAYNAGPGAVQKYKGVPPYRETQAYVAHVRAAYERQLRTNEGTPRSAGIPAGRSAGFQPARACVIQSREDGEGSPSQARGRSLAFARDDTEER